MMERFQRLQDWLAALFPGQSMSLSPASADASFRRYFRARFTDGKSLIVMDAPPEREDCRPFLHVAALLAASGVHVPSIKAENLEEGFLLLSDLGDTTYLAALNPDNADALYRDAIAALIKIQLGSRADTLPAYDRELLQRELKLFPDWYIGKHLGLSLSATQEQSLGSVFAKILDNNLAQPQVTVHRDYHSRNLMWVADDNPGILDFQDAVQGPITYDLASLFKDAYIAWEEAQILDWLIRYWESARKAGLPVAADFSDFYRDFEWMGVQRHLKVLGIFARLCHRDGKTGYVQDMPLVMKYLRAACARYLDLKPLLLLLDELEGRGSQVGYTF